MTEISSKIGEIQLGKKAAIIIGINQYENESIPVLSGAENDAEELHEILINNGRFQILPNHRLIGKAANRKSILKAVSELFRKTSTWDFILFYFSGHGMVDEYKDGYLAPYDTDPSDPFVAGINMEDLRRAIYQSKNSASVGIMLDCCYAGIMTETTKGNNGASKHIFADNIGKLAKSPGEGGTGIISGKFTLASSGADVQSREKEYTHPDTHVVHPHGIFSSYLLEALNGAAAEKRKDGIITLQDIKSFIEDRMKDQGQPPFHSIDNASYLDNIRIAIDPEKYKTQIDEYINQFQSWIRKNPSIEFIDFRKLSNAGKNLKGLISIDNDHPQIPSLTKLLNDELQIYEPKLKEWLDLFNNTNVAIEINEIKPKLYDRDFYSLENYLNFDRFKDIDDLNYNYLVALQAYITEPTQSPENLDYKILVDRINGIVKKSGLVKN